MPPEAKNSVQKSLFSFLVKSKTVLWMFATDSIYPESRAPEAPLHFPAFYHPLTDPDFSLTPCNRHGRLSEYQDNINRQGWVSTCLSSKSYQRIGEDLSHNTRVCYVIRQEFHLTNSFYKQALLDKLSTAIQTGPSKNRSAP